MNTDKFTVGDNITLAKANGQQDPIRATVTAYNGTGLLQCVVIKPPEHLLQSLRARGIFIGTGTPWTLNLFLLSFRSPKTWCDSQTLVEYKIKKVYDCV